MGMVCTCQFLCSFFSLLFFSCSSMGFPHVLLFCRQKACSAVGCPHGAVHIMKICSIVGFSTGCRPVTKLSFAPLWALHRLQFLLSAFVWCPLWTSVNTLVWAFPQAAGHSGSGTMECLLFLTLALVIPLLFFLFVLSSSLCTVIFFCLSIFARYVISSVLSLTVP